MAHYFQSLNFIRELQKENVSKSGYNRRNLIIWEFLFFMDLVSLISKEEVTDSW